MSEIVYRVVLNEFIAGLVDDEGGRRVWLAFGGEGRPPAAVNMLELREQDMPFLLDAVSRLAAALAEEQEEAEAA